MLYFRNINAANREVFEKSIRGELTGAGVFPVGPQWRRAAVSVADAEIIQIHGERACGAAAKDDAVLA